MSRYGEFTFGTDLFGWTPAAGTVTYTHSTWADLQAQLAARLHDSSLVHWPAAELQIYLQEAVRTFQHLTCFWRDRGTFTTSAATVFYDLPTQLSTLLPQTVTDRNLINVCQYHLIEPITSSWAGGWTGTEMFTMDDVAKALQRRRDQFLMETGTVVTHSTLSTGSVPSTGRIAFGETIVDIRRLAWITAGNAITPMWREDEPALTAYLQSWVTQASQIPWAYSILGPPPLTVQLAPVPSDTGTLDIVSVNSGSAFDPTTTSTHIGIPDDMVWIVKWGALADLLQKDGPARDPFRARFCEHRYRLGVQYCQMASIIVAAKIGSTPLHVWGISELDASNPTWQSATAATPTMIATAGLNIIAFYPPPVGATTITLDVVKNAPQIVSLSDYIQLGREQLDTILDYAEHLALFKSGGEEFADTIMQADSFMKQCVVYNERLSASAKDTIMARLQSSRQDLQQLRRLKAFGLGTAVPQPAQEEAYGGAVQA